MHEHLLAVGLDVGTSGVRAVAVGLGGHLVAEGRCDFPPQATRAQGPCVEQDPEAWVAASHAALWMMTHDLPRHSQILGIAVDATSGTFVLADSDYRPLTRGIMYSDLRAAAISEEVDGAMREDLQPYGVRIGAAFALPKIVHFARHESQVFARCRHIVHQTDWVVGNLGGRFDVTDASSGLKTGADPGTLTWPASIERLGIDRALLPGLVNPGTRIGSLTESAAAATGLPAGLPVVAGCTDGTAGCLASGACEAGDLNVTLGSTLVFKAVSDRPLQDPQAAIYNHRHPAGGFLPGAASSTGGEWIAKRFAGSDWDALGRAAAKKLPAERVVYPLVGSGERFPFVSAAARGFGLDAIDDPVEQFAAGMEGVAFLERIGIERLEGLGLPIRPTIFATGGGTSSSVWLAIRAAVNRREYSVPAYAECAVGAAVLAAMPQLGSCRAAVNAIVRSGRVVKPDGHLADAYDASYRRFCGALRERGYL